jgi:hypothetical protein
MPSELGDVYIESLSDADGQGIRLVLHFQSRSFLNSEFARVAIESAVQALSAEVVKEFKDEILRRVDFEKLAHLVLTKSAERVAEKISGAVAKGWS